MASFFYKRHIAKAISWRIVGTTDTIFLSWLVSGDIFIGLEIGAFEVFTKLFLYYCHEQLWLRINVPESKKRHLFKTITWRCIGTIDTILLAWIISGDPLTGFSVGVVEVITKMALYYFHERLWYKIDYGLDKIRRIRLWKRT